MESVFVVTSGCIALAVAAVFIGLAALTHVRDRTMSRIDPFATEELRILREARGERSATKLTRYFEVRTPPAGQVYGGNMLDHIRALDIPHVLYANDEGLFNEKGEHVCGINELRF